MPNGKDSNECSGSVRELIDDHIACDPAFREAFLREAFDAMRAGDISTGETILRDYLKMAAT